jgi:hypothetical protein
MMIQKKINAFLLRLRYLRLLLEINVLMGLSGARRDLGLRKARP